MQEKMAQNCLQGLDKLMDNTSSDDLEGVLQHYVLSRNIQEPVWTRWMARVKTAVVVVDNWSIIYATMVVVKTSKKTSLQLAKTVLDAFMLMKTKLPQNARH